MRPWICLLLFGAGLTATGAVPASANNMTPRSPSGVVNSPVRAPFLRHDLLRHQSLLGPFAFGSPFVYPGGYFDGYGMSSAASGAPTVVMLNGSPAAPPLPRRAAIEERTSVETTVDGVVIVRGPGSHHLGR